MTATPPGITLYCRQGTSDKVYQCAVEASGDLFVVNFAYGRRGSTLNTGTKTPHPVDEATARFIYDRLVSEKLAKGYYQGEDGSPYVQTPDEGRFTGLLPQLLNPVEEHEVNALLQDKLHYAQEKYDGRRIMIRKEDGLVTGINRKGLEIKLPLPLINSAAAIPGGFIMDGECLGDNCRVFDLLFHDGVDLRPQPYKKRLITLMNLVAGVSQRNIRTAQTAFTRVQKILLHKTLMQEKREGIVFKRWDAPYIPGRPNSGGPQLKLKFYATLSAVVSAINEQRSVELRLLNQDGWIVAGNVTIAPNHDVPPIGGVVEVRYLYAFPESRALYQPVYLGRRDDIDPSECVVSQLKFKAEQPE